MKLDILYNKFGVRVASRVAERLKTQNLSNLGNIREFRIRVEIQSSTTPSRNYTLAIAVKKHGKENINLFLSRPVLMGFSILFQIFSSGLSINRKKTENKKKSKAKKQKKQRMCQMYSPSLHYSMERQESIQVNTKNLQVLKQKRWTPRMILLVYYLTYMIMQNGFINKGDK